MSRRIDIGNDHQIELVEYEGEIAGVHVYHKRPDGTPCHGWAPFNNRPWVKLFNTIEGWDVEQDDPLTIAPSLQCLSCPDHGFIRDGQWVVA